MLVQTKSRFDFLLFSALLKHAAEINFDLQETEVEEFNFLHDIPWPGLAAVYPWVKLGGRICSSINQSLIKLETVRVEIGN